LLIRAYGRDDVGQAIDPRTRTLIIRIGTVTWMVRDKQAYDRPG